MELEDKVARAEVIDVSKLSGSVIKFGARVTLADEETDEEQTFQIVGEDEADIKAGRLSVTSPLARALIGKGKGDSVEVTTPRGAEILRSRHSSFWLTRRLTVIVGVLSGPSTALLGCSAIGTPGSLFDKRNISADLTWLTLGAEVSLALRKR